MVRRHNNPPGRVIMVDGWMDKTSYTEDQSRHFAVTDTSGQPYSLPAYIRAVAALQRGFTGRRMDGWIDGRIDRRIVAFSRRRQRVITTGERCERKWRRIYWAAIAAAMS